MAEVDIVEIMARGIGSQAVPEYADGALWREHWEWFLSGRSNPASVVHASNQASWIWVAESALSAIVAAGFRVAPAEPTLEMIEAAMPEAVKPLQGAVWGQRDRIEAIYAAMITTGNLAGRK